MHWTCTVRAEWKGCLQMHAFFGMLHYFSTKGILELTEKKVIALGKYILINVIANKKKGEKILSTNFLFQ